MKHLYCQSCGYCVSGIEINAESRCSECGAVLLGNVLPRRPINVLHAVIIACVGFLPTILFSMSVVVFAPREFGLSMHPVAVAVLYVAIFSPPLFALLAILLMRFLDCGRDILKFGFVVFLCITLGNCVLSFVTLFIINGILPMLPVDWPQIQY